MAWQGYIESRIGKVLTPAELKLLHELSPILMQPFQDELLMLDRKMESLVKTHPSFHWCGIYRLVGENLILTCYRGEPTPHAVIPKHSGICGAAVKENATINIKNVSEDPRYLSCDFRTKSELVVPIRNNNGEPIGEIDIDSHISNAFSKKDEADIEAVAIEVAPWLQKILTHHS